MVRRRWNDIIPMGPMNILVSKTVTLETRMGSQQKGGGGEVTRQGSMSPTPTGNEAVLLNLIILSRYFLCENTLNYLKATKFDYRAGVTVWSVGLWGALRVCQGTMRSKLFSQHQGISTFLNLLTFILTIQKQWWVNCQCLTVNQGSSTQPCIPILKDYFDDTNESTL